MNITSWNCHYGLTLKKYNTIMEYEPTILIIQECTKDNFDFIKSEWKNRNWYNDDLNNEESDLGIAIFSNNYKIDFFDNFNRKYRYVVPYVISNDKLKFILFAIWTKGGPFYKYDKNIIQAIQSVEYKDALKENAIIIGDFNTFAKDANDRLKKLEESIAPMINCTKNTNFWETFTYYDTTYGYGINDFCFVSKDIITKFNISIKIPNDWDTNGQDKNKWKGLSDHCPIIIKIKEKL
jgi:exonuclease III